MAAVTEKATLTKEQLNDVTDLVKDEGFQESVLKRLLMGNKKISADKSERDIQINEAVENAMKSNPSKLPASFATEDDILRKMLLKSTKQFMRKFANKKLSIEQPVQKSSVHEVKIIIEQSPNGSSNGPYVSSPEITTEMKISITRFLQGGFEQALIRELSVLDNFKKWSDLEFVDQCVEINKVAKSILNTQHFEKFMPPMNKETKKLATKTLLQWAGRNARAYFQKNQSDNLSDVTD